LELHDRPPVRRAGDIFADVGLRQCWDRALGHGTFGRTSSGIFNESPSLIRDLLV
jgi:hypothetical protein